MRLRRHRRVLRRLRLLRRRVERRFQNCKRNARGLSFTGVFCLNGRSLGEECFGFLEGFGEGFDEFFDGFGGDVQLGEHRGVEGFALTGQGVAEAFAAADVVGDMDDAGQPAAIGGEGHGVVVVAGDELEGAGEFPLGGEPGARAAGGRRR